MAKPPILTKRFELRCSPAEFRRWEKRAKQLKLPGVAAFVRVAANNAVQENGAAK